MLFLHGKSFFLRPAREFRHPSRGELKVRWRSNTYMQACQEGRRCPEHFVDNCVQGMVVWILRLITQALSIPISSNCMNLVNRRFLNSNTNAVGVFYSLKYEIPHVCSGRVAVCIVSTASVSRAQRLDLQKWSPTVWVNITRTNKVAALEDNTVEQHSVTSISPGVDTPMLRYTERGISFEEDQNENSYWAHKYGGRNGFGLSVLASDDYLPFHGSLVDVTVDFRLVSIHLGSTQPHYNQCKLLIKGKSR